MINKSYSYNLNQTSFHLKNYNTSWEGNTFQGNINTNIRRYKKE